MLDGGQTNNLNSKIMATRTQRGRNLFSTNPNGSKLAYTRFLVLRAAQNAGINLRSKIEVCCSVNDLLTLADKYGLKI